VFGHKPTWGIVPPRGHAVQGRVATTGISAIGPLGQSADDLAIALDAMAGADEIDGAGWHLHPELRLDRVEAALQPGRRSIRTRTIRFGPSRPSARMVTPGSARIARSSLSSSASRAASRRAARSSAALGTGVIERSR
jgi:Asp-tRNA(Asn)/Glu-tRNA(Gln) amidotransferase A subunit family amidase